VSPAATPGTNVIGSSDREASAAGLRSSGTVMPTLLLLDVRSLFIASESSSEPRTAHQAGSATQQLSPCNHNVPAELHSTSLQVQIDVSWVETLRGRMLASRDGTPW
jgi:hypothetical protein